MILQRYIAGNLVRGWLMVLMVLAAVFGLIGFIQELDHTRFDYDVLAVARYTLFNLPQQLVSLSPVIALLGGIIGIAGMDRTNELTIISCTGFSQRRLLRAIAMPTMLFMVILWLLMEFVSPVMQQSAEQQRYALRYKNQVRIPDGGVWAKYRNQYIHLDKMFKGGVPGDISLFEFDDASGELTRALHAKKAKVRPDRRWLFQGVREKTLVKGTLRSRRYKELEIPNLWSPDELPTVTLNSDSMRLSVLYKYSQYREDNEQPYERYENAFWQKMLLPLTVGAMVLLATPISANLGAKRDRNFGVNIALGALVGILFYLGTQIVFALGQLMGWNIQLVALTPALVVMAVAAILLHRMNW